MSDPRFRYHKYGHSDTGNYQQQLDQAIIKSPVLTHGHTKSEKDQRQGNDKRAGSVESFTGLVWILAGQQAGGQGEGDQAHRHVYQENPPPADQPYD
jgi:hypothetical protein